MKSSRGSVRNIGIMAHIDAGKTSLTERILFLSGRIRRPGEVDSGTTATDYLSVERERGITVKAACVRLAWQDCGVNLIDTPGHVDFGSEVQRSLRVLDGAILVICGVAGLQSRTEGMLRACRARGLPLLAFVNKMDRRGASFERVMGEFSALCPEALALQVPWGENDSWQGAVDLVSLEARDEASGTVLPSLPSEGLPGLPRQAIQAARLSLVERLAEQDDPVMEAWVAGLDPSPQDLARALRAASIAGTVVPVLLGSAFSDLAVSALLDAVAAFLPSPAEQGCPTGVDPASGLVLRRLPSPEELFSALVFKTQVEEQAGRLSWLRVWSGRLKPGDLMVEAGSGTALKAQRLFAIHADSLEDLDEAVAGDIAAVSLVATARKAAARTEASGMNGAAGSARSAAGSTGASLCAPEAPILYERIGFEEPVVSIALEPVAVADGEALQGALAVLLEDDPSLRASVDGETGRVTLAGMGELHLEVAVERLRAEQGIRLRSGKPQVSCRESLSGSAEATCDFDRDMNGERVRGQVSLRLSPRHRGAGRLVTLAPGLRLGAVYMEALRRGIEASASVGPSSSWPVEDYEAVILACAPPSTRQAELALEIAASMATRDCLGKAGTNVLEPWMRLEFRLPEECLGAAVTALSARGGRVEAIEDSGGGKTIQAAAPLRLLFGFASELRSATAGRASYQARFLRFEAEKR